MSNIKFTQYQKFDNNKDIKILDYAEIIKFYNRFEKSTRFKERILNHEFDLVKLIAYINDKFKNYIFNNSSLIYSLNIEFLETVNMLILTETVKFKFNIYIIEHIFY